LQTARTLVNSGGGNLESGHCLGTLLHARLAPEANLQQQTAATRAQPGGGGCDYLRLARHERRSTKAAPPLCKQGVRGSSPLGSTLVSGTFAIRIGGQRREYSSKVQQRCRRVEMLNGLRADRRAPSTLSKSSRWSPGYAHPSSLQSGCGAVSACHPRVDI
jgi:hypothetical protein